MPSSSLVLSVGTALLSAIVPTVSAQTYSYTLQDTYAGTNFYDNFNFFTDADPTHGFVSYVNQSVASSNGLISSGPNTAKWGVDTTNVLSTTSNGRMSVRLEGKNSYNHGLFIADIKHMPGSTCGVWPAFWTLGDGDWPANGEMDIIEGVNQQSTNQYTAHTAPSCTMSFPDQDGTVYSTDCALSTGGTAGCAVGSNGSLPDYGTNFNSNGGGVYAMQWTSSFIKIWFFARGNIPSSITAGTPDVSTFGRPQANFAGCSCDIDSHFKNHRIIFDTTFCGDWAGNVYGSSSCPNAADGMNGCVNYVANTPSAFSEAYWEVNYVKIFSETVSGSSASSSLCASGSATSSVSVSSSSRTTSLTTSSTKASTLLTTTRSSSTTLATTTTTKASTVSTSSSTRTTIVTTTSKAASSTTTSKSSTTSSKTSTTAPKSSTSSRTTSTSSVKTSSTTKKTSTSLKSSTSSLKTSSTTSRKTSFTTTTSRKTSSTTTTSRKTSSTTTSRKISSTTSSKTTAKSNAATAAATPTSTTAACPADNGKIYVANSKRFQIECSTDHVGGDLKMVTVSSGGLAACIKQCSLTTGCVDVTLSGTACYLKSSLKASKTSSANGAKLLA